MPARYTPEYMTAQYYKWYKAGKPTAAKFLLQIDPNDDGDVPARGTLSSWISQWEIDCKEMDEEVRKQLERGTVAEKVKMYQRIADQARDLSAKSYEWLRENPDKWTSSVALKMWAEATKLEQDVAGVPEALQKMIQMDDEKLLETIADAISEADPLLLKDAI